MMDEFDEKTVTRMVIKEKLQENFDGKIVRKDLTKTVMGIRFLISIIVIII